MGSLRIRRSLTAAERSEAPVAREGAPRAPADTTKDYLDRLVKLVPSEVIALYLAGKAAIQGTFPPDQPSAGSEPTYWIGWTGFCLVAVVAVRIWATRETNTPPQWPAVAIATLSFLIWIYSLGDVFARGFQVNLWAPLLATLLVLGWTFLVPLVYKGD